MSLGLLRICALGCFLAGCRTEPAGRSPQDDASSHPARGDRVVVESRAAEFFEARVLSVSEHRWRVEPLGGGETLTVPLADLYRLPPTKDVAVRPGQLAICNLGSRWVGCRIEQKSAPDQLRARTLQGENPSLSTAQVLVPSPLTELNLKQAFTRAASRAEFEAGAARAGDPVAPRGFRPTVRAKVVVHRNGGWYSGTVEEVHDDGVYVAFAPQGFRERVEPTSIVPDGQHPATPGRGDFVLVRPNSPVEPWQIARIVGASDREFRVTGPDAGERLISQRDVLPLVSE